MPQDRPQATGLRPYSGHRPHQTKSMWALSAADVTLRFNMSTYISEASHTSMSCSSSTQSELFSHHWNGWFHGVAVGFVAWWLHEEGVHWSNLKICNSCEQALPFAMRQLVALYQLLCRGVGCDPGWCQIPKLRSRLDECGTADCLQCGTWMERKLNTGSIHIEHVRRFHNSKGILSPLFQLQWLCVWPAEAYMCGMQVSNMKYVLNWRGAW